MRWFKKKTAVNGLASNSNNYTAPVLPDNFIVDSQEIGPKDVKAYIHGRAVECFGPDYYYGYTYQGGILNFYACSSKIHIAGRVPILAPAFMHDGRFEICHEGRTFVLVNEASKVSCSIVYEQLEPAIDLAEMDLDSWSSVPETMHLHWSLKKEVKYPGVISAIVFLLAAGFLALQARGYDTAYRQEISLQQTANAATDQKNSVDHSLPDVSQTIEQTSKDIVMAGGIIKQVRMGDGQKGLTFIIGMPDESSAQRLISGKPGATYQGGNVTLTTGGL